MNLENILSLDKFCKDDSIAFDFSNKYDITFIQFMNYAKYNRHNLEQVTKEMVEYYKVNYVAVCGGSDDHPYRGNLDGLVGLDNWSDPFYIGIFLKELITNRQHSKYIIGSADCAGAYTALLSSRYLDFQSLIFTTPVLSMAPFDLFNENRMSSVYSHEIRRNMADKAVKYQEYLDMFPMLCACVNKGIPVNIHWAKHIRGSDLFECERVRVIQNNLNSSLVVTDHDMPLEMDAHFLVKWLREEKKLSKLFRREIELGKIYLREADGR